MTLQFEWEKMTRSSKEVTRATFSSRLKQLKLDEEDVYQTGISLIIFTVCSYGS